MCGITELPWIELLSRFISLLEREERKKKNEYRATVTSVHPCASVHPLGTSVHLALCGGKERKISLSVKKNLRRLKFPPYAEIMLKKYRTDAVTQASKQARAWAMGTEVPTPIPKIAKSW